MTPDDKKRLKIDFTDDEQGSYLSNPSDEEAKELFDPGPRPCVMPEETTCFAVTLTHVMGELPMLLMSAKDVYMLTNKHISPSPSPSSELTILVVDRFNNSYQMNIIRQTSNKKSFILDDGWKKFVHNNKVARHDTLVFNRFYTSGTCFYRLEVLKVIKFSFQVLDMLKDGVEKVFHADRFADRLDMSLPDIQRGTPGYNRLRITNYSAIRLTGNVEVVFIRPLRRVLIVFDEDLFVYNIVLSDHVEAGWRGYEICRDWSNIIERNRLIRGDRIFIRKFISPDGHFYYRLNVSRKNDPAAGLEDESTNRNNRSGSSIEEIEDGNGAGGGNEIRVGSEEEIGATILGGNEETGSGSGYGGADQSYIGHKSDYD